MNSETSMPSIDELEICLLNSAEPIAKRTHAAFYLRTLGNARAVQIICRAVQNPSDSPLLRHELCYILGQIQDPSACPTLTEILSNPSDDVMVRHEAGEALGAIGNEESIEVLQTYSEDPAVEISETCRLALDLINWKKDQANKESENTDQNPYLSVDPAPADSVEITVEQLKEKLLDTQLSLFARYRAMFSLRNRGTEEAILALAAGLEDESALFRHEIAYVLGQAQHPASAPALIQSLQKEGENRMVRHEAAEALGAIGGAEAEEVLKLYLDDQEDCVKESCEVALDTMQYWVKREEQGA